MAKKRFERLWIFLFVLGIFLIGFAGAVLINFIGTTTQTAGSGAIAEPNNITHLLPSTTTPYNSLVAYYSFDSDGYIPQWVNGNVSGNTALRRFKL